VQKAGGTDTVCNTPATGPLGKEAGRQLQPLGAQLTRLSLQGAEASSATVGAAKVHRMCSAGYLQESSVDPTIQVLEITTPGSEQHQPLQAI
jgi:hypothetical protein